MSTEIEEVHEEAADNDDGYGEEEEEELHDVILNVYNVSSPFNLFLSLMGFGLYVTSVEVDGMEYTFRAGNGGDESGVVAGALRHLDLRDLVIVGATRLRISQVLEKIEALRQEFRGDSYNFFTKNCNHFSDRLCKELTGSGIPSYVNSITKIGALCKCFLPAADSNEELRENVVVHGREYAFRPKPKDGRNEYIISAPEGELDWCKGLRLHEFVRVGRTQLDERQVSDLVYGLQDEFNLASYHHFTRNCHHFADRVCRELTGNGIPTWVNRVAMIWPLCQCMLPPDPEELRKHARRSPRNL